MLSKLLKCCYHKMLPCILPPPFPVKSGRTYLSLNAAPICRVKSVHSKSAKYERRMSKVTQRIKCKE